TIAEYVDMIRLKTSYLFCGAVSLGAYLADAPERDRELLWRAVELMGLAFQIKDDYLDIYGNPEFGKRQGGDILEGKRTWLLLTAYSKDANAVKEILSITNDDEKIVSMTALYTQLGIGKAALEEVQRLSDKATEVLGQLSVEAQELKQLFIALVTREV
ncbi:MAG: polyprenyl synthetase family protein, partial [Bacteroidales bacterium]|uniref:polyprenyl synthetase family protein n=1 Tax=Porphyromonas sp. TaxID=1924944 RepID=UPI00297863BC